MRIIGFEAKKNAVLRFENKKTAHLGRKSKYTEIWFSKNPLFFAPPLIKVLDVDNRSPEFHSRHNCTNRFVDVDFNTLDIMFNLQTWVIVLDFFGIGSGPSQGGSSMA